MFRFPPEVTFCFLKADQILKCIPNAIVCNRFRWVRILTKSAEGADGKNGGAGMREVSEAGKNRKENPEADGGKILKNYCRADGCTETENNKLT